MEKLELVRHGEGGMEATIVFEKAKSIICETETTTQYTGLYLQVMMDMVASWNRNRRLFHDRKSGIEMIADERCEQIEKHGRTMENDLKEYSEKQLFHIGFALLHDEPSAELASKPWFMHMFNKGYKERLVYASAFFAAELDRLEFIEYKTAKH